MSIREQRRRSFNEIAEDYAASRPGYPQELFEDAIRQSGIPDGGRILEIGCGPGTASIPFAERGYGMVCLELGQDLAETARRRMAGFPSVKILTTRFEGWPLEPEGFDMVLAAMSLHWVKRKVAFTKSAAALRRGGSLAILSTVVKGCTDRGLQTELDKLTARYLARSYSSVRKDARRVVDVVCDLLHRTFRSPSAPHLASKDRRYVEKIKRLGCYSQVQVLHYPWNKTYDAEGYLQLLDTYSDFRILSQGSRGELHARISDLINAHGGSITRKSESRLLLAKKA
jgi:SAM-dependent methyltransferase